MRIGIVGGVCAVVVTAWMVDVGSPGVLHAAQRTPPRADVLERFLADTAQPLVSYCAVRRLAVVARGGKMTASLTAKTTLDPVTGFTYVITDEVGSGMLRSRVLHGVLEAESAAKQREHGTHGALTEANYEFSAGTMTPEGLLRVGIRPKRKDTLLMEGSILLTTPDADLVQLEGILVKRPSFWTRKVQIVRHYGRVGGVRVPLTITSTADILFAGQSQFTMDYLYESINGQSVGPRAPNTPQ